MAKDLKSQDDLNSGSVCHTLYQTQILSEQCFIHYIAWRRYFMDIYHFCIRILLKYLFYSTTLNRANFSNNCFFSGIPETDSRFAVLTNSFHLYHIAYSKTLMLYHLPACTFTDKFLAADGFETVSGPTLVKLRGILGRIISTFGLSPTKNRFLTTRDVQ